MTERPFLTSRLSGFGESVFAEMTQLATAHNAVNLGQGFPDFDGPDFVKEAAIAAIRAGHNQYSRSGGLLPLARAVAAHQQRFYDLDYHPEDEITTYAGATEAIFSTLTALLDPGDEVVFFEPFYDSYPACVALAGALPRVVTLRPPRFDFDPDALEAAVGPRTRAILLNTPNNPSGKVFSPAELAHIAELCRRYDLIAITDEVYEHLVFEGEHVPLATLPGMRERTVLISSTGKTFSFTGWKIGYSCAPPGLTAALRTVHQFVTFCVATPFQHAMAAALGAADDYYRRFREEYRARRDRLGRGLTEAGLDVLDPAGTYFTLADIRPLGFTDDVDFCRQLPGRVGVAAIPSSAFFVNKEVGRQLVRFAFCKTEATLDAGIERLKRLRAP
ncbi:MAG TPA: aminotransferase class I/II-fold pyridoxal phosphate-dependent enzyme [Vicinamibacteria bacterium]|nr:aminotransferase class I/II-fold pyridoxal phosphate-dependent enzyme [Vicinamibacteria bacterium]